MRILGGLVAQNVSHMNAYIFLTLLHRCLREPGPLLTVSVFVFELYAFILFLFFELYAYTRYKLLCNYNSSSSSDTGSEEE